MASSVYAEMLAGPEALHIAFRIERPRLVWLQTVHRLHFSFDGCRLYKKSVSANKNCPGRRHAIAKLAYL